MLKLGGKGIKNGKPVQLMFIGLSHENLKRLKKGQPIHTTSEEFGLEGNIEVTIFAGSTEQSMMREVHELVGPDTKVSIDPRLKD